MKQKKYSVVLLIIIVFMLSMVFLLNKLNKESYKVKDISGDRKNLGDISIVYTSYTSLFDHRAMALNKDNLKVYDNPKYIVERDYINIDKNNRKFIESTTDEYMYQNDKNIGTINVLNKYEKDINTNYIQIKNKGLKNNKVKKIEIDLPKKYNELYLTPSFTTIINDKVYTLLESYETSKAYIISINLKNNKFTDLNEIKMSESDEYFLDYNIESIRFYNDNKIYLEFRYQGKREYTNFVIYDIPTNTFSKSNEFMNKIASQGRYLSQNRFDYEIKDNKLSVLIGDNKGNISKLIYDINKDNINLNKEVNYKLNLGYTQEDITFSRVKARMIDNKIYTMFQPKTNLRSNYSEEVNYMMLEGVKPAILTVFDTVNNKIEYKSELFNGNAHLINNLYMVKNY